MKKSPEISVIELLLKDRELHSPKNGFALVGIDDFEFFGEQMYTLSNYHTLEEALLAKDIIKDQVNCLIYDSKGSVY